jgi:Domain of unknown function (DUF4406)
MRLYIAGQIRLRPYNVTEAEFDEAANKLRAAGHEIYSAIEYNRQHGIIGPAATDSDIMRRFLLSNDLSWICHHAEGIALLDSWRHSKGAIAEVKVGYAIGLPVRYWIRYVTDLI